MKKIFMKFCDDRKKEYCLKTTIWQDNDKKHVTKEAIFPEAINFMKEIASYPEQLSLFYPEVDVCPVEIKGNQLVFDYIKGEDLEQQYIEAVRISDKEKFTELLKFHLSLIVGSKSNQCVFENSSYFQKYFGNGDAFHGKVGLKVSNYDATASNIVICNKKPMFIDYEWVFLQPLPRDLVIYHCIRELYEHNKGFEKFVTLDEALKIIDCKSEQKQLEKVYWQFFKLINGLDNEINFSDKKNKCLKKTEIIEDFKYHKVILEAEVLHGLAENHKVSNYWKESSDENYKVSQYWKESSEANAHLNSEIQNYKMQIEALQNEMAPYIAFYHRVHGSKAWKIAAKAKKIIKK